MTKAKIQKGILERMGFSEAESRAYAALLEIGPASMSDLVRKTGLHRPEAYRAVARIMDAGLVRAMPKGKLRSYVAESPQKLEKLFQDMEDDFNAEIHELHEKYEMRDRRPTVVYSEGTAAIKGVFSDVVHSLNKNDVYYRYSSGLTLARRRYVPADYRSVRDRKSLERLIITDKSSMVRMGKKLGKSMRSVPADSDLFDLDVTQIIYGTKVALIDYNTKSVIVIDNKMIAEFQKKIFKLLYARLEK